MGISYEQLRTAVIVSKCTASLSIFSSIWLIQNIWRHEKKIRLFYHRIILGKSISDLIAISSVFIGTWAIPADTKQNPVFQPFGTTTTCKIQGFVSSLADHTSILYYGILMLFHLLFIRYAYTETQFRRIEPFLIIFVFGVGIVSASIALGLDAYHNSTFWCYLAVDDVGGSHPERTSSKIVFYQWIIGGYMWIFFVMAFVVVTMAIIYHHVAKVEKMIVLFIPQSEIEGSMKLSKRVTRQAFLYLLVLVLTYIFVAMTRLIEAITGKSIDSYSLVVLTLIFLPLQSFFTLLVYVEKDFIELKRTHPEMSTFQKTMTVFKGETEDDYYEIPVD